MIDGGIWANEKFAELPCMARLLQLGIINMVDDQGRTKAHPAYLRSQIFPYDDVSLEDMSRWLQLMATNGTVILYQVDGKEYIQLTNWWEYQSLLFASPSEYPRPHDWRDRIRYNAKGNRILTCNWRTVDGETVTDTCDQNGEPLPIVATLPPSNPGGRPRKNPPENPPGPSPENVNKDQINTNKDQAEAEVATRAHTRVSEQPSPAATSATADPNVARVWTKWDANMPGTKTQVIVDGVNDLLMQYSASEIEEAITIACKRNKRTLGYVQGVLAKGVYSQAPPERTTNRGVAAVTAYMEKKGMRHERD